MGKLSKQSYKGIDYIELKDLTPMQCESLRSLLKRNQIIHLQIDGEIKRDCVQYCHYEEWLTTEAEVFSGSVVEANETKTSPTSLPKVALGT